MPDEDFHFTPEQLAQLEHWLLAQTYSGGFDQDTGESNDYLRKVEMSQYLPAAIERIINGKTNY